MTDSNQVNQDRGSAFTAELARDVEHRERARSLRPLRRLAPFVLAYPRLIAAFTLFLALASALTLVLPLAFRLVVDCGFGGAPDSSLCSSVSIGSSLSSYFLTGMGVAMLLGIVSALRFYFISKLGERVVADLRRAVYDHLVSLSPDFYASTRTGEVLSRLTTDTTLIQTVVGSSLSIALRTLATTMGALVLMVVVSWKLALMVLAIGPLILAPIVLFGRRVQRLSRFSQDRLADASARASETLRAVETVQAFTREPEERRRFAQAVEATFAAAMRRVRVRSAMTAVIFSVILTGLIGVLWFGAVQVKAGTITPGAMTQFVMYAFVAVSGAGVLTETYAETMRAAGATERLMELLSEVPQISAPLVPSKLPESVAGAITFEDVTFAYPGRPNPPALTAVSLRAEPGQTVALVGPSGAGKSTVFQLLTRFYDPCSGRIKLDGVDLSKLDPSALRTNLSIVQQNAPLFAGTVAENIKFGRLNANHDDAVDAARAANADAFIRALPDGYDTVIGENGATLSGGQRQRLAIARAVLRDAPILLLDEATSALDSESENAIQTALESLASGKTTLVIAHRLATVRKADVILVLDNGQIVDRGSHDELLARGGLYSRYVDLQFSGTQASVW